MVSRLWPLDLDGGGLAPAVERLAHDLRTGRGAEISVGEFLQGERFDPALEATVFRIIQGALTNALKHARAPHISVSLTREAGALVALVQDDGVGFDVVSASGGVGISEMRERAVLAGGQLSVDSAPGKGTTVRLEVPA
jgi:signal transduction histidine kinase